MTSMTDTPGNSLADTLVLALNQCQQQTQCIDCQSSQIDRLQRENEQLRKELQDAKNSAGTMLLPEEPDRTQDLFQKHIEAQAEIQILKKRIRLYKEKAGKKSSVPLSSPSRTPPTPAPSSPRPIVAKRGISEMLDKPGASSRALEATEGSRDQQAAEDRTPTTSSSPSRKRTRGLSCDDRNMLDNLPIDITHTKPPSMHVFAQGQVEEEPATGHAFVKDGGPDISSYGTGNVRRDTATREDSRYHRLDGLLASTPLSKTPLARPRSRSPPPPDSLRKPQGHQFPDIFDTHHAISNLKHVPQTRTQDGFTSSESISDLDHAKPHLTHARQGYSECNFNNPAPSKPSERVTKLTEPLRSLPLGSLSFSSFKPNPRWLASHNVPYDDFVNDRQQERMRTLATTLPHLPGEVPGRPSTDHELLIQFLGPGSEARIANLTFIARQNLVLEAKTKRVAEHFKLTDQRAELGHDHEAVPLGFWSTDMPGSQEAYENKMASRQKDREEVRRRYNEAMVGQGRWIFADE